jgi:hypothetical protein
MLTYGAATRRTMRCVTLEWEAVPLRPDRLPRGLPRAPGLYSFQGSHDAKPLFGVLYIGQAENLRERVRTILCERFYWQDRKEMGLYSDIWQPELRFARLARELLTEVEALLIAAHAPSFNNLHVRTTRKWYERKFPDLVVLNGGAKGALLPATCGLYYVSEQWPTPAGSLAAVTHE